jgi:hypothetical protein
MRYLKSNAGLKDRVGRLSDRLLSRIVPQATAAAVETWCCGFQSGPICQTNCYRESMCRNGRLCSRICSVQMGSGSVSCGAWSCNADC